MEIRDILRAVDHTLLGQTATWAEIQALCDDAVEYGCASVCIAPCYVARAVEYLSGRVKVCTVVGFPNGNSTAAAKCFEAAEAARQGADEIDMVANLGLVREGRYDEVLREIDAVCEACARPVKVIIETCLLSDEEKVAMCGVVSRSKAAFIKRSTGFAGGGATPHDVELLCRNVSGGTLVKAAGGIASLEDAENYLKLGAARLGTSRVVAVVKKIGKLDSAAETAGKGE